MKCEGNGVRSCSSWGIPPWEPPASEETVGEGVRVEDPQRYSTRWKDMERKKKPEF
jgi:hypothetical protein